MAGVRLDSIPEESAPIRLSDLPPDEQSPIASNLAKIDAQEKASKFEEPSTIAYYFNRLKKGAAGFLGIPGDVLQAVKPTSKNLFEMANNPAITMPDDQRAAIREEAGLKAIRPAVDPSSIEGFIEKPIATSADYRGAFGHDPKMRTGSDLKRYTGAVVEMAGAGGPFGLAMKAKNVPALVTSTFGSGVGMEAGGDVASGLGLDRQAGEAVGALAGGLSSAVLPNVTGAAVDAAKRRFSPEANRAAGESAAAREIGEQLQSYPQAKANIERSVEVSDMVPGFNPSLPARSNAPGLLAEEKRLIAASPKTLNRAVENIEANNRAIADFVDTKFPVGTGEPAATRVANLQKMSAQRLEGMKTAIDDKLDDAVRVFESNPSNAENGTRLRDLFFKQKELYSGIRAQKYTEVYKEAEKLGVKANVDDAVQYVDDVLKGEMNAYQQSEIPSVFRQIKSKFAKEVSNEPRIKTTPTGKKIRLYDTAPAEKPAADISFEELHSLFKRTNRDLASLRGSTAQDKDFQIHLLEDLKTILRQKIEAFEGQGFGEVAVKLKEANRFYADEYLPRFKQGFGGDIAAKYGTGEFRTPDQMVTSLITKANNTQAAKDFKLIFDESPEAWSALRAGYMDELYRNGNVIGRDGRINQRALDTFLRKHDPTLAEFPQIKGELQKLALDNEGLLARRAQIVASEKKLAANDLYRLFQGRDPTEVLTEATSNPNAMRVLSMVAKRDPGMSNGLARGIAEHVVAQPDPAAFLVKNMPAIEAGLKPLGKDHMRNLQTAVEAMSINSRSLPPSSINAASVLPDSVAEKLGSSPRAIISHVLNVERGRSGATQEGAAFLGRWFDKLRREHKAAAMEAAFYDKDVARAMAAVVANPASEKAQMDFVQQMTALGVRAVVAGQQ